MTEQIITYCKGYESVPAREIAALTRDDLMEIITRYNVIVRDLCCGELDVVADDELDVVADEEEAAELRRQYAECMVPVEGEGTAGNPEGSWRLTYEEHERLLAEAAERFGEMGEARS
jgi:hypothetical protein